MNQSGFNGMSLVGFVAVAHFGKVAEIRKKLNELVDSDETIYRVTKPWKKAKDS